MRKIRSKCLKLCGYVAFMAFLTFVLAYYTRVNENVDFHISEENLFKATPRPLRRTNGERLSNFDKHVTGKCRKRGDIDLIVTYTLWGNAMMPVYIITCSSKKPTGKKFQFVSDTFFRKHGDEKPTVRFSSAKKGELYSLVLARARSGLEDIFEDDQNIIKWMVSNLEGNNLAQGIYKWNVRNMGIEIKEYTAPFSESHNQSLYQFILFQQEQFIDTKIMDGQKIKTHFDELIRKKMLKLVASAAFITGSDEKLE
ncbi:uncharacterized protein LOC120338697 [Styela clava]